jgi:hypothetical protein
MLRLLLLFSLLCGTLTAQPILPTDAPRSPETARTVFTVFTPQERTEQTIWRLHAAGNPQTELTTHRLRDYSDSTQILLPPTATTRLNTYVERQATQDSLVIEPGRVAIEEILDYRGVLSPEQRQLVESYLAIRHGLTLNQRIPRHYLAPINGSTQVVWDANAGRDFRYRIAGIGVDAAARLDHRRGTSVHAPGEVSMKWPQDADADGYLLWGDDNLPTARTLINGNITELNRTWRVQATGHVPPTTLRINPNKFFARLLPGEQWVLLREGSPALLATAIEDGNPEWSNLEWAEGESTFRLGLQCSGCSPLPLPDPDDFFTLTQVSPNPALAGTTIDVRVALAEPSPLFLTLIDATGRVVLQHRLPTGTHHLTQLQLPAAGMYALHLRAMDAQRTSLKLFAQ